MKNKTINKRILAITLFLSVFFFIQFFIPTLSFAANELNWENPNKSGNNPYKFKTQDVLNSQMMMQVVGCTGVVDKVSGAITGFVQNKTKEIADKIIMNAAIKACTAAKLGEKAAVIPIINMNWAELVNETDCKPIQKTEDSKVASELEKLQKKAEADKKRDECFNGIAIRLAKDQLTSMTRYTMNWINYSRKLPEYHWTANHQRPVLR